MPWKVQNKDGVKAASEKIVKLLTNDSNFLYYAIERGWVEFDGIDWEREGEIYARLVCDGSTSLPKDLSAVPDKYLWIMCYHSGKKRFLVPDPLVKELEWRVQKLILQDNPENSELVKAIFPGSPDSPSLCWKPYNDSRKLPFELAKVLSPLLPLLPGYYCDLVQRDGGLRNHWQPAPKSRRMKDLRTAILEALGQTEKVRTPVAVKTQFDKALESLRDSDLDTGSFKRVKKMLKVKMDKLSQAELDEYKVACLEADQPWLLVRLPLHMIADLKELVITSYLTIQTEFWPPYILTLDDVDEDVADWMVLDRQTFLKLPPDLQVEALSVPPSTCLRMEYFGWNLTDMRDWIHQMLLVKPAHLTNDEKRFLHDLNTIIDLAELAEYDLHKGLKDVVFKTVFTKGALDDNVAEQWRRACAWTLAGAAALYMMEDGENPVALIKQEVPEKDQKSMAQNLMKLAYAARKEDTRDLLILAFRRCLGVVTETEEGERVEGLLVAGDL